ncbi:MULTISPECIES: enoyl-CoA hydratase [Rhodomicrobium]|uniref:enoyl-CoA hydratase n=1 Tax=Rhodomicrobium TaxID=1068 RepID=UPI000B4BDCCE|nr:MULTISPECIES: enoyl-CoA hydratase [Rhodomicrobium]
MSAEAQTINAAPSQPCLLREDRGAVALLTLNRPQSRNALSGELLTALGAALAEIDESKSVHAVVLTGAPPAFCAGHDLREITAHRADADGGQAFFDGLMRLCSGVMQFVMMSPKPVIAAIDGIAMAAGCQLVASCDLAVASEESQFATPGVNIGLFCSTPMVALSRNIGRKHAMEMLLLGEMIGAQRAAEMGLVNRVVPRERVLPVAMEMANVIASKSPMTLRTGKEAFYRQLEMPVADAYEYGSRIMVENLLRADAEEGIGAFLEKRQPRWPDEK